MIASILTDIEGTTSSISFVKDVLFPYARARLPAFVATHADEPEVRHWLREAAKEAGFASVTQQEIVDRLIAWIDEDRKSTALKALQGMIWKDGYTGGEYRAHVYPEVPARLHAWKTQGKRLYVYSSGSVPAQKLLFGHTDAGDLTPLFSGYFDTEVGGKRDAQSYRRIATVIGDAPDTILFLSDIVQELDAARDAGFKTTLLARVPAQCPAAGMHPCVADFDAIETDV
ncbi:MAG: acireductone synthase [Rhodanobacter sp.]|jgi:enolase-phosphatase E1|nr:acireductone synthase [Rhodanobacter sp.]